MRPRRPVVYVFARAPALGAVKRRLAAEVGALAALRFQRSTAADLLRRLAGDRRFRMVLALTPDRAALRRGPWPRGLARVPQGGGDLGRRMARALARERAAPAAVVGSDIPDLRPAHVAAAFRALGGADVVFGPAADGGYWLVGRRPGLDVARLFRGVRWSGPYALADTRANLGKRRRAALLATLEDVDDAAALRRRRRSGAR